MPVYPGSTADPVEVAPLDPDAVLEYEMDWGSATNTDPWLAAEETIAVSKWTVPVGLGAGDGATLVETEAGDVTPLGPSIESAGKVARVWLYVDGAARGAEFIIENTIRSSLGRVESRSLRLKVASK